MTNLHFSYTGPEALEMTKQTFPKTWEKEVATSITLLKSIMNFYKTDVLTVYQCFLNTGARPDNCIVTLAALQVMNNNMRLHREIKQLKTEQAQCGNQLHALETMSSVSWDEKRTLRGFYVNKQNTHETKINELFNQFEVIGFTTVVYQKSLFEK